MDNRVNIIHGSAIVQRGLTEILTKDYKRSVQCFDTLDAYLKTVESCCEKCIFFTEDFIANSESFLSYMSDCRDIKSYSIVNNESNQWLDKNPYTIYLYDSPAKISAQVKEAFRIQEMAEEVNEGLSNREIEVLKQVALGFANKEIAEKLFISTHTVMSHRKNMTEKLGIKSISGLTVYAIINNYIDTSHMDVKDLI